MLAKDRLKLSAVYSNKTSQQYVDEIPSGSESVIILLKMFPAVTDANLTNNGEN